MASPHYVRGVSCPHCYDQTSAKQKERYAERRKQIALAQARGEEHFRRNTGFDRKKQKKEGKSQS